MPGEAPRKIEELASTRFARLYNRRHPSFWICDRMGLLVMDEVFDCWTVAKNPYDYHLYFNEWSKIDTADMVRRDRNHQHYRLQRRQ